MEETEFPSKADQLKRINGLERLYSKPVVGERWYAVNAKWWQLFLQDDGMGTSLGKIDNRMLYDESLERLKETAQEEIDYVLKPEEVWKQLRNWYRGSPEICGVVVQGKNETPVIDMFPARFEIQLETVSSTIADAESQEPAEAGSKVEVSKLADNFAASRYLKMCELKEEVAKFLNKSSDVLKLFLKAPESEGESEFEALNEENDTLMQQTLDEALPRCGLIVYSIKVQVSELAPISELPPQKITAFKKFIPDNPEVGQRLDAKKGDTWYEAIISEVLVDKTNNKKLKVHFLSFETKDDEIFALNSEDIRGPYSKVSDWRTQLRVGQTVELNKRYYSSASGWTEAEVIKIDRNGTKLKRNTSVVEKPAEEEDSMTYFGKFVNGINNGLKKILPGSRKSSDRYFSYSSRANSQYINSQAQQQVQQNGMFKPPSLKTFNFRKSANNNNTTTKDSDKLATEQSDSEREVSENNLVESGSPKQLTVENGVATTAAAIKKVLPVSEHGLVLLRVSSGYPSYAAYSSIYMSSQKFGKEVVVDLGSEFIAPEYTHIQKQTSKHIFSFNRNLESKPEVHGIVGLRNLGNTCYMNSSLQCLFQATVLSNYFLSGEYKKDINRRNPLGFGGKMASQYGKLVEQVFSDKYSTVSPTDFRNMISNCLQSFQGYGQQDAHEFVSLLIDGLHEDLNRIKNKPYFEDKEDEKKTDAELANEEWTNFLARNDSVFVENLYGQLKSHLVCPDCGNEATKFDAFSTLLVPIPVKEINYLKIAVMFLEPRKIRVESFGKNQKQKHTFLPIDSTEALTTIKDKEEEKTEESESEPKVEVLKTRCVRLVFEQEGGLISPVAVAKFVCSSLDLNIENLVITDLKLNKPETVVFDPDRTEQKKYDLRYRNITDIEFAAYELEPLLEKPVEELVNKESSEESVENKGKVGLNEELKTDKLKGGDLSGGKYPEGLKLEKETSEENREVAEGPIPPKNSQFVFSEDTLLENSAVNNLHQKRVWQELEDSVERKSESEESDKTDVCYLSVQYKVDQSFYNYKALRISDFVRFQESRTSNYDIYSFVWQRAKDMFEYSSLSASLNKSGENIDEIKDIAFELFRVAYQKIELDLSSKPFKLLKGYNSDHVEVRVTKRGADCMNPDINKEGGKSYFFREDVHTANESLNVGFVALHSSVQNMFSVGDKELTLYDCLDAFRTAEKLGKEDEWYCKKCKAHVQATKKMDVYRTGDILVIGLKRFKGERFRREKLCHPVEFPVKGLDLSGYIQHDSDSNIFDLFGVSCHMGGMGGGHYVAKVKNNYVVTDNNLSESKVASQSENSQNKSKRTTKKKNKEITEGKDNVEVVKKIVETPQDIWYEISDSSVRRTSETSVVTEHAYVLYYQRRKTAADSNNTLLNDALVEQEKKSLKDNANLEELGKQKLLSL